MRDHALVTLTVALLGLVVALEDGIGSGLRDGMQLMYAANGREGTPNVIDSVRQVGKRDGASCAVLFRGGPAGQPKPPAAHYCARGDTLYLLESSSGAWIAQRPIGTRMTMEFARQNGTHVRYSTGSTSRATIGSRTFNVIHTTVLTQDSLGRPIRRLTERYAPALITAVGGRFESADSATVGGWKETQVFELRAIR